MIDYHWARSDELRDAAIFFARLIALDDSYVSHGEVQTGLSTDGRTWIDTLEARMIADFQSFGTERSLAVAIGPDGLAGASVIAWETTPHVDYMVIEDLVVLPAMRAHGIGAGLVAFAESEGVARGMAWAFLESGLHNEGAHRFFERHGFSAMSKVFSKKLAPDR